MRRRWRPHRRRSGRWSSDPAQLARWWPGVARVEEARPDSWTTVLASPRGKVVRADYARVEAVEGERVQWSQELAGTPFERILASSLDRGLAGARRARWNQGGDRPRPPAARLGALRPVAVPRRRRAPGQRRPRGPERALRRAAPVRWWGWGDDGHEVVLPDAALHLLRNDARSRSRRPQGAGGPGRREAARARGSPRPPACAWRAPWGGSMSPRSAWSGCCTPPARAIPTWCACAAAMPPALPTRWSRRARPRRWRLC